MMTVSMLTMSWNIDLNKYKDIIFLYSEKGPRRLRSIWELQKEIFVDKQDKYTMDPG